MPKIRAAIRSPDGSLKKAEERIPLGKKAAVLDTLKSASPKLSQEQSSDSMNVHSAHRSACISSEVKNSNKATGRQRPEMASTNIKLEGLNSGSPKPSQECVPDSAKHATANAPQAENDENLLLNT